MCAVLSMTPATEESGISSATLARTAAVEGRVSSKYRGLCWDKKHNAWRVRIFYGGKQRHVGRFKDHAAAARAYDKAAVYLYGPKAILNFTMEHCLNDPCEVSGFIILAKEQATQDSQQQQQQHFPTNLSLDGSLFGCNSTSSSQIGEEDDLHCQLSLLATEHATVPVDNAILQQQQRQLLLQGSTYQNPIRQQQWQPQPQAACPAHLESSTRVLLQQQHAYGPIGSHLMLQQPQQPQDNSAVYCSMDGNYAPAMNLPMQSTAFPASCSAQRFAGSGRILSGSTSSCNGGAMVVVTPPTPLLCGTSSTTCLPGQGHMLSMGGTSAGGCSSTPIQYITLFDGQQVLLPAATAAQNAANNILLHNQQGSNHCSMVAACSPMQQQQEQQVMLMSQQVHVPVCTALASTSFSSRSASSPVKLMPQCLPYSPQQLTFGLSSSILPTNGSPHVSPVKLPVSLGLALPAAMLPC